MELPLRKATILRAWGTPCAESAQSCHLCTGENRPSAQSRALLGVNRAHLQGELDMTDLHIRSLESTTSFSTRNVMPKDKPLRVEGLRRGSGSQRAQADPLDDIVSYLHGEHTEITISAGSAASDHIDHLNPDA